MVEPPKDVLFREGDEKPKRRPTGKVSGADLAVVMVLGFYLYGQTRPEQYRECWAFDAKDCEMAADRLAAILNRMNPKVLRVVESSMDPIALCAALYAMFQQAQERERVRFVQLARAHGDAQGLNGGDAARAVAEAAARVTQQQTQAGNPAAVRRGNNGTTPVDEGLIPRSPDIPFA